MFEFFIAKKYLIPRKRQLSATLIAMMSVGVISLVVWLLLMFLSITEGIETNWLKKLTHLNAPIKIVPTANYYKSYYYQIDAYSANSGYAHKTLRDKLKTDIVDPYDLDEDEDLPYGFPEPIKGVNGKPLDLAKSVESLLVSFKQQDKSLEFSDFQAAGAMLKLKLLRPQAPNVTSSFTDEQNVLAQMSYIAPIDESNTYLQKLLIPPSTEDGTHLLYLASVAGQNSKVDAPDTLKKPERTLFQQRIKDLLASMTICSLTSINEQFELPKHFIQDNTKLQAAAYVQNGTIQHILIPKEKSFFKKPPSKLLLYGYLERSHGALVFKAHKSNFVKQIQFEPLYIDGRVEFSSKLINQDYSQLESAANLRFFLTTTLQNQKLSGRANFVNLRPSNIQFSSSDVQTPWAALGKQRKLSLSHSLDKDCAIILPKNYKDSGVKIGDRGFISYGAATASSVQEQRIGIYVAGFYDPGIMGVGARCALMHPEIVQTIVKSTQSFNQDRNLSNAFQVWFKDLNRTKAYKTQIETKLQDTGLYPYFEVITFYDYEFAKDLMNQFASDKNLFTLIGILILVVACSNIISFLVLMVNDKKKEIGIMQSMGASKQSITLIFASIGIFVGLIGSLIGVSLAIVTLKNIDQVAHFLSYLQGHSAFNEAFFGNSLPKTLSPTATFFVLLTTPLLSLLAGLVPAYKACKIDPAKILRSEI